MAQNTVNLDALIPRDDFGDKPEAKAGGQPRSAISVTDLDSGFFSRSLRKPDFQRETTQWSPDKVVDLIQAFLDGDLIPAVILWQRSTEIFVIDGAHRLSAMMAWIRDDYGDRQTSLDFFGGCVPPEQMKVAERTRKLVEMRIGSFAMFQYLGRNRTPPSDDLKARRLARLGSTSILIQWESATITKAAEESFFKINQAAQPIDPTERRILQSRRSSTAIAARCIVRGGRGHKYWADFAQTVQADIERLGTELYKLLYEPPAGDSPIKTLDVPVAGRGYNTLPFVFDLVSWASGQPLPEKLTSRRNTPIAKNDADGSATVRDLKSVRQIVTQITGTEPGSLGIHPVIYFYSRSGMFQPISFLASCGFLRDLEKTRKLPEFIRIRADFENFLFENKEFISLTTNRLGAGARSLGRIMELYKKVMGLLIDRRTGEQIKQSLFEDPSFTHLAVVKAPSPRAGLQQNSNRKIKGSTKTAVYFRDAVQAAPRCAACCAILHRNSIVFDHVRRRSEGGTGDAANAQMMHPYCNSLKG